MRQYGASVEDVDWCRSDLRACLDWLEGRGHTRVAILGHSLGGVKAIYYQARLEDPRVTAIIAMSPPRLSYSYVVASESGEEFLSNYRQAEALIADGRPGALMKVSFPINHYFSAANFVNKLGPKEKFNVIRLGEKLKVPLLVLGGSRERRAHLRGVAADLVEAAVESPYRKACVIEGANHFYSGKRDEAVGFILDWLGELVAAPPA